MKCPVCGHDIRAGEYVVKRFLMVRNASFELKVSREEPGYQHADCHDPKGDYHS